MDFPGLWNAGDRKFTIGSNIGDSELGTVGVLRYFGGDLKLCEEVGKACFQHLFLLSVRVELKRPGEGTIALSLHHGWNHRVLCCCLTVHLVCSEVKAMSPLMLP